MAGSLNKVQLIGHLGKDPEVRTMQSGDRIVSFSVATSESWRDKNSGERKEKTEWHTIVVFNEGLGKVAEQYLKKGAPVYLEGQIQTRKWQDRDGNDRYSTEIVVPRFGGALVLLGKKDDDAGETDARRSRDAPGREAPRATVTSGRGNAASGAERARRLQEELDDEIPF